MTPAWQYELRTLDGHVLDRALKLDHLTGFAWKAIEDQGYSQTRVYHAVHLPTGAVHAYRDRGRVWHYAPLPAP